MKPDCQNCKTDEFMEYTGEDRLSESGELYYVRIYKCYKCECENEEE